MREMTNRITFLTNISFMVLNNATFIVQWLLLFHLRPNIGGYGFDNIMLLWGLAASTFGFSHALFQGAFQLPSFIQQGKLDPFLVQPKNVLLGVITSQTNSSAIGDFIYGYLIVIIFCFSPANLILFTLFSLSGGLVITAFAVITGSFSFWIIKGELLSENLNNMLSTSPPILTASSKAGYACCSTPWFLWALWYTIPCILCWNSTFPSCWPPSPSPSLSAFWQSFFSIGGFVGILPAV